MREVASSIGSLVILASVSAVLLLACSPSVSFPTPNPTYGLFPFIDLAGDLEVEGRFVEAIDAYDEAIRLEPEWADAYKYRGDVYSRLREYENAFKDYRESVRLDPLSTWASENARLSEREAVG